LKLDLVISQLGPGGSERVLTTMANYWARQSKSIDLISFSDETQVPFYSLDVGIRHIPLGLSEDSRNGIMGAVNNLRRIRRVRRAIRKTSPNLVISFGDSTNAVVLLATMGLKLPVIVSERADPRLLASGRLWRAMCRIVYPFAARLVVQTPEAAQYYRVWQFRPPVVIPNPVPRAPNGPKAHTTLRRPTVVGIGRLTREKGFDLLLEAFGRVSGRHQNWTLVIFGDGPMRPFLEARVKSLGLNDRVWMPGFVKDIYTVLGQTDLFVLPSRSEGFPNALCEAMACGVASIAMDCPSGPRHIVRSGLDGLLVPEGDISSLAKAMDWLMSDEEARRLIGGRASTVSERFSVSKVMGMWEDLLKEVMKRKGNSKQ